MAANTMRRTTVNKAMKINRLYDRTAAHRYRNPYPLPRSLSGLEKRHILDNTGLNNFCDINTSTPAKDQALERGDYINLAMLGAEAFLAAAGHLTTSQRIIRFVRRDELGWLESPIHTEPDAASFARVMKDNTAWVDSLLELLRETRREEAARHG